MEFYFVFNVGWKHFHLFHLRIPRFDSIRRNCDALDVLLPPKLHFKTMIWLFSFLFEVCLKPLDEVYDSSVPYMLWSIQQPPFVLWNVALIDESFPQPVSVDLVLLLVVLDASKGPIVGEPYTSKPFPQRRRHLRLRTKPHPPANVG